MRNRAVATQRVAKTIQLMDVGLSSAVTPMPVRAPQLRHILAVAGIGMPHVRHFGIAAT
jgi:hypothetical protein